MRCMEPKGLEKKMRDGRLRNEKIAHSTKARDTRVVHSGKQEAEDNLYGNRDTLVKSWGRTSGYEVLHSVLQIRRCEKLLT